MPDTSADAAPEPTEDEVVYDSAAELLAAEVVDEAELTFPSDEARQAFITELEASDSDVEVTPVEDPLANFDSGFDQLVTNAAGELVRVKRPVSVWP